MFDRSKTLPPYTVRLDYRPLRTVFLVSPDVASVDLDAAMRFNCESVGGRCNVFLVVDGDNIDDENWDWLAWIDPDTIVSFVPLDSSLKEEIARRSGPLRLVDPGDDYYYDERPSRLLDRGERHATPLVPGLEVLRAARAGWWEPTLVDPVISADAPADIRAFVIQNFGVWPDRTPFDAARASFETIRTYIEDEFSLGALLEALSGWGQFVYPLQFSAAYARVRGYAKTYLHETTLVVIGDELEDRLCAWNTLATLRETARGGMPVVWLPKTLCERESLQPALGRWLLRVADPGGQTNRFAQFCSASIPEEQLTTLSTVLVRDLPLGRRFRRDWEPILPEPQEKLFVDLRETHEVIRADASEEHITATGPKHLETSDGPWMVDLYVEYNPEMYPNYINRSFWWQLPRRMAALNLMTTAPARITADRFPSLEVKRGARITIKIPTERAFFHHLLIGDSIQLDSSRWGTTSGLVGIETSDKGRYLRGVLDTLGGLYNASNVLEERFWRATFEKLGGRRPGTENARKLAVKNKVSKLLRKLDQNNGFDEAAESIADSVLRLAREQGLARRERKFIHFLVEAQAELAAFNAKEHPNEPWEFDEGDLKRAISRLMAWGVLSAGLRRACPACGTSTWYAARDIDDRFTCPGCGEVDPLGPEEPWFYRLNALVDAACNVHGLTPVILALGQLLSDAHTSFIYYPSTVLLQAGKTEENLYRELDLVCVQDGQLIIGELKDSQSLFRSEHFDQMMEAAKRVLPDRLIFSAMEAQPNSFVSREISRVATELRSLGIKTEWYPLHEWIFEPKPVR